MTNPFSNFRFYDYILLIVSVFVVITSNMMTGNVSPLVLVATSLGVIALLFLAKGNVWGQIICIIFCTLYGIISFKIKYYGEMITYVFMTLPMAVFSTVSWLKNPSKEDKATVTIHKLTKREKVLTTLLSIIVTWTFYYILKYFDTANLTISTLSITTSFLASYLTYYRNPYYAFWYGLNDIVLIILWVLATIENFGYFPMIICFAIFLINDSYAFILWKLRQKKQGL